MPSSHLATKALSQPATYTDSPLYLPLLSISILILAIAIAAAILALMNWKRSDHYAEAAAQLQDNPPFDTTTVTEPKFRAYETKRKARQLATGATVALIMMAFAWTLPTLMDGILGQVS